jgi:cation:H+ antiporter
MVTNIILLILGLVLVIKGADFLVSGASAMAKKLNVPDLAIGLTVVAFGTSLPELVVNSYASAGGFDDIVLGNIIGSNNFNLFIILGITGLIYPISVQSSTAWREIPISLFAVILLLLLSNGLLFTGKHIVSRIDGIILMVFFALFLLYVFKQLKSDPVVENMDLKSYSNKKIAVFIAAGVAMLVLGGRFSVNNAVSIATELGISEKIIGLTILAAGTSLPELATSVVAGIKKNPDIAIGNVIGSNIFNISLILAVSSLIKPISFDIKFNIDLLILGGGTLLLLLAMITGKRRIIDRWEAGILLVFYIGYIFMSVIAEA